MSGKKAPARSNVRTPAKPKNVTRSSYLLLAAAIGIMLLVVLVIFLIVTLSREGISSAEDNWIVRRKASSGSYAYFKLAETGDIDGFTLSPDASILLSSSSEMDRTVVYTADDDACPVDQIIYYYAAQAYEGAAESGREILVDDESLIKIEDTVVSEYRGLPYACYFYAADLSGSETAGEEPINQWLIGYVDVDENTSILVSVLNRCAGEDGFAEDDVMMSYFERALDALTIESDS